MDTVKVLSSLSLSFSMLPRYLYHFLPWKRTQYINPSAATEA